MIKEIFNNSTYEYISLNNYAHAIVDAKAVAKNLPVNVNATNFFRNNFKIYKYTSVVQGPVLIFGSLNSSRIQDYENYSVPLDYITYVLRLPNL